MAATAIVIAAATDLAGLSALPAKVLAAGVSFLLVFALRRSVVFSAREVARRACAAHPADLRCACVRCWIALAHKLVLPAPGPEFYARFIVAGGAMFASAEIAYFLFSPAPSFFMPSVDGFGGTAYRPRLPQHLDGRPLGAGGGPGRLVRFPRLQRPAAGDVRHHRAATSGPIRRTSCCSSGRSGSCPICRPSCCGRCGGFALFLYAAARTAGSSASICCSWRSLRPSPSTSSSARTASSRRRC